MVYDLDLNPDRDRILLYRKSRVAHQWTREEADYIYRELEKLLPLMKPSDEPVTLKG